MTKKQFQIAETFGRAIQHQQSGRLREAEILYRQILAQQPAHADSLHMLGLIAYRAGRQDVAADMIQRAIALNCNSSAAAYSNLGGALRAQGRLDDAILAFRQAIALKRDFPEAHHNLGNSLRDKGDLESAIAAYREAIALKPLFPSAYNNLGIALKEKGMVEDAIAAYRQALSLKPDYADAYNNLGNILYSNGQLNGSISAYRQAISIKHNSAEAHNNLGNALMDKRLLDEAVSAFRQAIALKPSFAEAHKNLGNALVDKEQFDEAVRVLRQAIALKPSFAEAYNSLGDALFSKGSIGEAVAAYRQATVLKPDDYQAFSNLGLALRRNKQINEAIAAFGESLRRKPDYAEAHNNFAGALTDIGDLDGAIGSYRRAIALRPDYSVAHSNLLFTLHYHPDYDPKFIAEEHRLWNAQHVEPLGAPIRNYSNDPNPKRRLRIGYVSPDFRNHVVSLFILPFLEHHDKVEVEVYAYADVPAPDRITERVRAYTDHWRSLIGLTDVQVTDLILEDRIDILIDLAGHTGGNRLLVFAHRPAPVQVTYLGYPGTTGLAAMDYRLTDTHADPPGQGEEYCSEQLIRLPACAWCFQPQDRSWPDPKPRTVGQPMTLGCFNNFAKVTAPMLRVWGSILHALPGSRLLLKGHGLGSSDARQRVTTVLRAQGIGAELRELRGWEPSYSAHMELYERVDIALDTFPYHGTTTTCDALWMGVPVVSLAGKAHVSRVGVSLLRNLGLTELIATSEAEYIRIAADLAKDPSRLTTLRTTLRERMQQSPLMDAPRFTRNIENAYRLMWRRWCATV